MWLLSRLAIGLSFLLTNLSGHARADDMAETGWRILANWDGQFYERIALKGYPDLTSTAFFPLFPLVSRGLMCVGLPFPIAGALINNLAFLAALWVLYGWVKQRHGIGAARWATAVLAWCPFALFSGVAYTEGLFLLLTTACLKAFDQRQYGWAAVWGALATATRPTGMVLILALLLTAWRERLGIKAYLAGAASAIGLLLFSGYGWLRFGTPLAFVEAQKAWRSTGVAWQGWLKILRQVFLGPIDVAQGTLKAPWHPLVVLIILVLAYVLWQKRQQVGAARADYGLFFLAVVFWLMAGDPLINLVMILGSLYLLWHLRRELSPVVVIYGLAGLGLILLSGSTMSLGRIAYGMVSLAIALAVLLAKTPRWGYLTLGWFAVLLVIYSNRFAQQAWAG